MRTGPRVTILLRRLIQYRVPLLNRLRKECAAHGIELRVVYGQASESDAKRKDSASLPWADEVHSRWFKVGNTELLWQPCPPEASDCDLLIMTQEIKILSNYPFLLGRLLGGRKVAFWGHGHSLQSKNPSGLRERWKMFLMTRVDWWFAYTGHTRDILLQHGFPDEQITCLYNAIDNEEFSRDLNAVPDSLLASLRSGIDLAVDAPLGLYCGSLYEDKRIELMVAAAERIHAAIPSFRLVVVGDGPARPELEARIAAHDWARWVGVLSGVEKAAWFRLAKAIVSPGAVGLHVLDAFASGVPLFTTTNALHGPEIEYLENGKNGFVLPDNVDDYSAAIIALLNDPARYRTICEAGRVAAGRYTIANMTDNFVNGIRKCLG
jgi:L-malate glycosyltransferase